MVKIVKKNEKERQRTNNYNNDWSKRNRDKKRAYALNWKLNNPVNYRVKALYDNIQKRHSKYDGICINKDIIRQFITYSQKCEFCGINYVYYSNLKSDIMKRPSIDRIDSNSGYTIDNVQVMCFGCNVLKSDMTNEDFICLLRERGELEE